jgi:hypothetical protein
VPTPTARPGANPVEFWRLLTIGSALLPVLTLTSPMAALEAAAGPAFHRLRAATLAVAFVFSCACVLVAAVVGVDASVTPVMARSLIAWFGLALIGGRILGWHHCWVVPWGTLCVLVFWGYNGDARGYVWWEFTAQPATHIPSLLLAGGLFVAGVTAYALSPWRLRRLVRAARLGRSSKKSRSDTAASTESDDTRSGGACRRDSSATEVPALH